MDLFSVARKLESGDKLKVTYRYPSQGDDNQYGIRSDKLVDISVERKRIYTNFRGQTPIWIEEGEVIEVSEDDGIYEEGSINN